MMSDAFSARNQLPEKSTVCEREWRPRRVFAEEIIAMITHLSCATSAVLVRNKEDPRAHFTPT